MCSSDLEPVLADPEVTEVMVNAGSGCWVERRGVLEAVPLTLSEREVLLIVERSITPLGLRLDLAAPMVDAATPVVGNAKAEVVRTADELRAELLQGLVQPVLWAKSVQTMAAAGVDTYVEVGPGRVLTGLAAWATSIPPRCRS